MADWLLATVAAALPASRAAVLRTPEAAVAGDLTKSGWG